MTYKLMIVDDEQANLRLLERLFRRDYQVVTADSGAEALRLLAQHDVALLITDQRMPGMTGIELLKEAAVMRPQMVRIILTGYTDVGALVDAINCGQVYKYITKPWNNDELRLTVTRALEFYEANKARHELVHANQRLSARLTEMTRGFVRTVADALEAKDGYVHGHARRVSGYAVSVGRRMGLDGAALEQLALGAFLHDIGKIGTPDSLLLKPAPLTDEERAVMQFHTERGARMLAGIPDMQEIIAAVRHHHENYDGTGYPEGLCGAQIPLAARIIHVTDAYDAMTSPRPFREAMSHEQALVQLEAGAGAQFDPAVVRTFAEIETIGRIRRTLADGAYDALLLQPIVHTIDAADCTVEELTGRIATEPALAIAVLREANAGAPRPTAQLAAACATLGADRLRRLAAPRWLLSVDAFRAGDEEARAHAIRCATAARLLAERTGLLKPADAHTLGLLHDAGETLLAALFPAEVEAMRGLTDEARIEQEVAVFGVDHAQVGQWLLDACGLPRQLTALVQTHHDVIRINDPGALLLHLANVIAHADDPYKVTALDALGSDRLALLGLGRADLAEIHAAATAALEQYQLAVLC
jgi:putative two-component system response regulator